MRIKLTKMTKTTSSAGNNNPVAGISLAVFQSSINCKTLSNKMLEGKYWDNRVNPRRRELKQQLGSQADRESESHFGPRKPKTK